jgi:hypothetical protein
MAPSCAVCRKTVENPAEGLTLAAMGKPLFTVHKEPCSKLVQAGVGLVSLMALKGLHGYMATRAPRTLALIERVNQLRSGTVDSP